MFAYAFIIFCFHKFLEVKMWKTFCALLCGSLMASSVFAAENILPMVLNLENLTLVQL